VSDTDEASLVDLLNKTTELLFSSVDLQQIVQAVTDAGTQLSGAEFGAFFYTLANDDGEVFTLYTLSGAPREAFSKFPHPRNTPIFAPTFNGDAVMRLADVTKDPRYGQWAPYHGMPPNHLPVCSYLAVPVRLRSGQVIGGLFFGHKLPNMFTERHELLIVGVASQAALAIDNAQLFEHSRKATEAAKKSADAERAARAEVERVSMMKDEFLATLSHELRTPLNAILGWSEVLMSRTPEGNDARRGLETIGRNARAQAQLIDDLLDMNRIVSGKIRLEVQPVDLASIVQAALDSVRPMAEQKDVRVLPTLDTMSGNLYGDPHRLQQIVWNLLSNAIKFTPRGGRVDVLLRRIESQIEISVSDTGIGIDAEFLPHLFERFRQADASTTRRFGGLGLGLSIVRQLVELHGGTVRAESGGANRGSSFIVRLPVRAVRDTPSSRTVVGAPAMPTPAPISLDGLAILVVDDEPDARELLTRLLTDAGAKVTSAFSVEDALTQIRAKRPDVLVSDIGMPERDGYQLIRVVRKLPPDQGGRTPAIALTAFARSEDRTRALLAGYQVHIAKPIEPHELIVTIGSLTGRTG
jgi:signal transduction histidine kinase/CheY-like chemotaxis protein